MSELRSFLSNLSPALATFLFCAAIGAVTGVLLGGATGLLNGLFAFATWIVLGLLFGGIAWVVDTLSRWRSSVTGPQAVDKDPALEALRERFARGELSENQFESMLQHLKEV